MTLGQSIHLSCFFDGKPSWAIASLKVLEAVNWNSTRASCELEQSALLLRIPCANNFPEVLDDLVLFLISTIVGMLFPVINVNIGNTANQKLELAFVKDIHKIGWNQLVETRNESVKLLLYPFLNLPLRNKPDPLH